MEKQQAIECFESAFGWGAQDLFTAAGRINVIGEHIDYCGGKVFPAALPTLFGVHKTALTI